MPPPVGALVQMSYLMLAPAQPPPTALDVATTLVQSGSVLTGALERAVGALMPAASAGVHVFLLAVRVLPSGVTMIPQASGSGCGRPSATWLLSAAGGVQLLPAATSSSPALQLVFGAFVPAASWAPPACPAPAANHTSFAAGLLQSQQQPGAPELATVAANLSATVAGAFGLAAAAMPAAAQPQLAVMSALAPAAASPSPGGGGAGAGSDGGVAGRVAGGVLGGLAAVGVVAAIVWRVRQKRRPRRRLLNSANEQLSSSWRGGRGGGATGGAPLGVSRPTGADGAHHAGGAMQVTRNPMDTVLLTLMHTGGGDPSTLSPPPPPDAPHVTRNVLLGAALGGHDGHGGAGGGVSTFAPIPVHPPAEVAPAAPPRVRWTRGGAGATARAAEV
jgi:hypothetical protein